MNSTNMNTNERFEQFATYSLARGGKTGDEVRSEIKTFISTEKISY